MKKDEHGTAAVEAALVLPIIILIVILLAEYGHYYLNVYRYQQAVFAGARAGALAQEDKETAALSETVQVLGDMGVTVAGEDISVDPDKASSVSGRSYTVVSIDTPFTPMVQYAQALLPARVSVKASQLNY